MRVAFAIALIALAAMPLAAAQPELGGRIEELVVRFRTNETADLWINASVDGGSARGLRFLSDANFDGTVTEDEARGAERFARDALVTGSPELERARRSLLLDDRAPVDTGSLAVRIEGLAGPTRSDEPARLVLETRVRWPGSNETENRTFEIPGDAVVQSAYVLVEAPPGLFVANATGINGAKPAVDAREVEGFAEQSRGIMALFAPPPPPPPEAEGEEATKNDPVPGVGALALLAALGAAALAARGRRR